MSKKVFLTAVKFYQLTAVILFYKLDCHDKLLKSKHYSYLCTSILYTDGNTFWQLKNSNLHLTAVSPLQLWLFRQNIEEQKQLYKRRISFGEYNSSKSSFDSCQILQKRDESCQMLAMIVIVKIFFFYFHKTTVELQNR